MVRLPMKRDQQPALPFNATHASTICLYLGFWALFIRLLLQPGDQESFIAASQTNPDRGEKGNTLTTAVYSLSVEVAKLQLS